MHRIVSLSIAFAVALLASPLKLYAQCVDQPRKVTLSKENIIALKSYLCSTRASADTAQFRVEYYRLNDTIVSLLLTNGSSVKLQQILGNVKLIPNDVSNVYADLVRRFGTTADIPRIEGEIVTSLAVRPADYKPVNPDDAAAPAEEDKIGPRKLRTLLGPGDPSGVSYPAIEEITALRKQTIPDNLSYYYARAETCDDKSDFTCKKFGDTNVAMTFWRYMAAEDYARFLANAKAYNAQLLQVRKNKADAKAEFFPTDHSYFDDALEKFISGGSIPRDFTILKGFYQVASCGTDEGDLPGLGGWSFSSVDRVVRIDAVLIENLSKKPLSIGPLFGETNSDKSLRVAEPMLATAANPVALGGISATIPPAHAGIVLTRIVFTMPPEELEIYRKYRESMDAIHGALGSNGFVGNVAAYQAPDPKDYTYGPTLAVTGATVNSNRIDFTARPLANFLDLTSASEAGSCPYLSSWNDTDQQWISYGKVLHKGQGKGHAYTETVTFPDLRTRFRIEEREPELAHVQDLKLIVQLRDGSTQSFSPVRPTIASGDREISLMWSEAADFVFTLPETIKASDVVETRLRITGYYERYSNLLAEQEQQTRATPLPVRIKSVETSVLPR